MMKPAPSPDAPAETKPRLPHERDQRSQGHTSDEPNPVIEQAARDLQQGQVDTDLRNGGGPDHEHREALLREAARPRPQSAG